MVVEYLITIKTKKESTKIRNIFVKFQAPFSQKNINIKLYMSCKAFIRSIV